MNYGLLSLIVYISSVCDYVMFYVRHNYLVYYTCRYILISVCCLPSANQSRRRNRHNTMEKVDAVDDPVVPQEECKIIVTL